MIVVDLGCAERHWTGLQGEDLYEESINALIERFHPETLYGFDPGLEEQRTVEQRNGTQIITERKAAWVYDGTIGYVDDGLRSRVTTRHEEPRVPCFDLARFITELPEDEIVVKMDVEAAEYPLLGHLASEGADDRISLLLVEWHEDMRIAGLRCPVEEWA